MSAPESTARPSHGRALGGGRREHAVEEAERQRAPASAPAGPRRRAAPRRAAGPSSRRRLTGVRSRRDQDAERRRITTSARTPSRLASRIAGRSTPIPPPPSSAARRRAPRRSGERPGGRREQRSPAAASPAPWRVASTRVGQRLAVAAEPLEPARCGTASERRCRPSWPSGVRRRRRRSRPGPSRGTRRSRSCRAARWSAASCASAAAGSGEQDQSASERGQQAGHLVKTLRSGRCGP